MNMHSPVALRGLAPLSTSHALHASSRQWPETNCYVDLWVELLHAWGCDPVAALPFTVSMDFEGDSFTFFKFPAADLETLFGAVVQELSIYDDLQHHVLQQTAQNRVVLVEVDGFFLPDTSGTSYRREHTKTTIGIDFLDPERHEASYFHNSTRALLSGADYDGTLAAMPERLPPYVEVVKRVGQPLNGTALRAASRALLRHHLTRRPAGNPISAYRAAFPAHLAVLLERSGEYFHRYAFNTMRQLGANFELLGSYAAWLDPAALGDVAAECERIAAEAKVLQYRVARFVHRKRGDNCTELFDTLEGAYERAMAGLLRYA